MIKQEVDSSPANKIEFVTIDRNWIAGGKSSINLSYNQPLGNALESVSLTNNKFMRSTWGTQLYILRDKIGGVGIANVSGNVFEDDGTPVTINTGNSY